MPRRSVGPRVFILALLLITIAVRYAEPVQDSDLFWHLAYAKQMLAAGTLVPDHAAFSWTPASNQMIYCAWLSELLLYLLWRGLGLAGLFALRYAVLVACVALCWGQARRLGVQRSPLAGVLLFVLALASPIGMLIRPQLLSFLFVNLVAWAYFRARHAARAGAPVLRWLLVVPAVVALWVNCHGGFLLIAPFLLASAAGEGLNLRFSPALALGRPAYRQLLGCWALAALASLATPYGLRYPLQLLNDLLPGGMPRPDQVRNAEYQSIFAPSGAAFHFVDFLGLMTLVLVVLVVRKAARESTGRRLDWAILLANAACVPFYVAFVRSTLLWPPVFAYSALDLSAGSPLQPRRSGRLAGLAAAVLVLLLAARACYEAVRRPVYASFPGFGISYVSPVVEAEFLAAHPIGPRLYNLYDTGGYLLWRLDPAYKVMIDSRAFPYLGWFAEQERFTRGQSFAAFLAKYPARVAVIDLVNAACIHNFTHAPFWRLAFYGPTAAVFVREDVSLPEAAAHFAPDRLRHLRNAATAATVFDFAVSVADLPAAWQVLHQLETRLRPQAEPRVLTAVLAYRDAHRALAAGDFPAALALFERALRGKEVSQRDALIHRLLVSETAPVLPGQAPRNPALAQALVRLAMPDPG